jgi:hypothetical protein
MILTFAESERKTICNVEEPVGMMPDLVGAAITLEKVSRL